MMNSNNIFFFFDGLSETFYPSSLELAKTTHIDNLTSRSISGFYHSIITPNYNLPRTESIIPFFFGLEPQEYLGRAALELIEYGINVRPMTWVASFRIVNNNKNPQERSININNQIVDWLKSTCKEISQEFNIDCIISPYSSHKNIIIIWSSYYPKIRLSTKRFSEAARANDLLIIERREHQVKCPPKVSSSVKVWGWPKGSLNGAFKNIGAEVRYSKVECFDFQAYISDIEAIIADLVMEKQNNESHVFYVKDTDKASHLGHTEIKIKALEVFDKLIGKLAEIISGNDKMIITSDHITNIGAKQGEHGLIPFLIYQPNNKKTQPFKFCEINLRNRKDSLFLSGHNFRNLFY
jgi:2,3-bisphosphoglycerate-independent phosphoglycerate mutase